MATINSTPTAEPYPLSGVVVRQAFEEVGDQEFRRYGGSLVSTAWISQGRDVDRKHVGYMLGPRDRDAARSLTRISVRAHNVIPQRIELNEALHQELTSNIKRYLNVGPDYRYADLSAVLYRLGAAMAYYANWGEVSTTLIRGGAPVDCQSMRTIVDAMPMKGAVFVPRQAAFVDTPAAFWVLASAINGEGSRCVSDQFEVDAQNNAIRYQNYEGADCFVGLVHAARILLNMYALSGAGAVGALALTKGIHSVTTVVSHTDEGGYLRDVLRCGTFAQPFGGIYVESVNGFTMFPTVPRGDRAGAQAFLDGIALKTAAAAALSDPLQSYGGRMYPTLVSLGATTEAGDANDAELGPAENRELRRRIKDASEGWCTNYARIISGFFTDDAGGVSRASEALRAMFGLAAQAPPANRHMAGRTLAPFYWIEPTTLFEYSDSSQATAHGFGVMAGTSERIESQPYPNLTVLVESPLYESVAYEHRSTRTVPALVHLYKHPDDGLGNIVPHRFRTQEAALVGGGHAGADPMPDTVRGAHRAGLAMGTYMWEHGMCNIPSPAEFLYTGRQMGVRVRTCELNDDFTSAYTHVIVPTDYKDGERNVYYRAIRPMALGVGKMGRDPRNVRRSRAHAEAALSKTTAKTSSVGIAVPFAMGPVDGDPMDHTPYDDAAAAADHAVYEEHGGVDHLVHVVGAPAARGAARRIVVTDQPARAVLGKAAAAAPGAGGRPAPAILGEGAPPAPPAEGPMAVDLPADAPIPAAPLDGAAPDAPEGGVDPGAGDG